VPTVIHVARLVWFDVHYAVDGRMKIRHQTVAEILDFRWIHEIPPTGVGHRRAHPTAERLRDPLKSAQVRKRKMTEYQDSTKEVAVQIFHLLF
jgi:hypothetical protein